MKKTKIETIIILGILIIYLIFSLVTSAFFEENTKIYNYIINPLFWILLCVVLKFWLKSGYGTNKFKKIITQSTLIAVLSYIIIYLISGLFVEFGKNPNARTIKGILTNFWITGTVIICREYVRFLIIDNVFEKQKKSTGIILIIILTLLDIRGVSFKGLNFYYIYKIIVSKVLPAASRNILFTYFAYYRCYIGAIYYDLIISLVLWLAPILPKMPWFMESLIDIALPMILLLYIRFNINKKDYFKRKEKKDDAEPRSVIFLVIISIAAIWFALGIFPIKPIAIATGSMEPTIQIGDVAIIKKCNPNGVEVGDIIEYQMPGYTVVHRIIEKNYDDGVYYFKTKGDNNTQPDKDLVNEDQLIGKVLFKIKFIGYPAIWVTHVRSQNEIDVEI